MTKPSVAVEDHLQMLTDQIRLNAYERAILQVVRPGDVVIDLGAGLGILSFLAVRAGAARVYAIEKEDSLDLAQAVAVENGIADKIVFIKENSLDVQLTEKADVLISETLGCFGLDENSLKFTADARRRLLKPGARMIPESIVPWLVPVEVPGIYAQAEPWRNIVGFDFSAAIAELLSKMGMIQVGREHYLAEPKALGMINFLADDGNDAHWELGFEVTHTGLVHGLAGWFEVQLCPGVSFSTSPDDAATHWQQAFFPLAQDQEVNRGQRLEVLVQLLALGRGDEAEISVHVRVGG